MPQANARTVARSLLFLLMNSCRVKIVPCNTVFSEINCKLNEIILFYARRKPVFILLVVIFSRLITFAPEDNIMRKFFLIGLLFLLSIPAWATHQRAAEITYEWRGGNTYEFTLTCYTYTPSLAGVQRDSLLMEWGDGFADYVPRVVYQELGDNFTLNVYKMTHDYSSSGTYVISMEDPDRNYGVVNVPNSVNISISFGAAFLFVVQPSFSRK